jgi:hypothetical protein
MQIGWDDIENQGNFKNLVYNMVTTRNFCSKNFHSVYSLQALEEICLNLHGEVCLLGDFNVDLLDSSHSLFPRFLDFLEM